jgi:cytochrome c oxidase subunit 2
LLFLHDFINIILLFVITFVGWVIVAILFNTRVNKTLLEIQIIESVWTIIPAVILVQIAIPSLILLYMLDESADACISIKAIGHQWYWRYEYTDFWSNSGPQALEFDAYIVPTRELESGIFRLLDVDNRTVVPLGVRIRIIISAADVLHSWTVPSLGVKADAVPGRLNQVKFNRSRPGLFFGQCSEICGANHRFIPIVVEVVNTDTFISWAVASKE